MAIRVVINTHVKPEHTDAMLAYWRQKSALCSAEEGNLQYETFRSVIEPGHFALLELWRDQPTYDRHWQAELRRDKPSFDRGPRARGRDGVEFYFEHRYYQHRNGIWQVADQQLEI
jgi:quinol monooxygenase YgiN